MAATSKPVRKALKRGKELPKDEMEGLFGTPRNKASNATRKREKKILGKMEQLRGKGKHKEADEINKKLPQGSIHRADRLHKGSLDKKKSQLKQEKLNKLRRK